MYFISSNKMPQKTFNFILYFILFHFKYNDPGLKYPLDAEAVCHH